METHLLTLSEVHLSVIKALYFNNMISALEISKLTGTSIPTITKHIEELIAANFIVEKGFAASNSGRRPMVYSLIADKYYILSVAIDQFYTRMVVVDFNGNFITEINEIEINTKQPGALENLIDSVSTFMKQSGVDQDKIFVAGISMPGLIDLNEGNNRSFFPVEGTSLRTLLTERLNIPVFIDNDSSVIALSELKFGIGRTRSEVMVINLSWGIGLGIIINQKIYRGFKGYAGEFSHIPLFDNDRICSCGKKGCLETQASLITIEDNALQEIKRGELTTLKLNNGKVSISSIISAALNGVTLSIKLISYAGYQIGRALAILIHVLNPEVIVLSGRATQAGKFLLPPIQQAINEHSIPTITDDIDVRLSENGIDAQLIGTAALAIEQITKEFFNSHQQKQQQPRQQLTEK